MSPSAIDRIREALATPGKERTPHVRFFEEVDPALIVAACDQVPAARQNKVVADLRRGSAAVLPKDGSDGPRVLVPREALYQLLDAGAAPTEAPAHAPSEAPDVPPFAHPN